MLVIQVVEILWTKMTFEDAFHARLPQGPEVVPRLLAELRAAQDPTTPARGPERTLAVCS